MANQIYVGDKQVSKVYIGPDEVYNEAVIPVYSVTITAIGCTTSALTSILANGHEEIDITFLEEGYILPDANINITGASYAYNSDTKKLSIWDPTDDVQINLRAIEDTFYLTFSSATPFTMNKSSRLSHDGRLMYSLDKITWADLSTSQTPAATTIYIRGQDNTHVQGVPNYNTLIFSRSDISVSGNIECLVDYQKVMNAVQIPYSSEHPFNWLFRGQYIKDAGGLLLTNNNFGTEHAFSFSALFYKCTSLEIPPELPLTNLNSAQYSGMFEGCTSLKTAPILPATVLSWSCYGYMFRDCSNLVTPPSLPATTLAENCYQYMFYGCTSLATPASLPATTLADSCYEAMFSGCTALETPPQLPATTLPAASYRFMFEGCTSLTTLPNFDKDMTFDCYCCWEMFKNCSLIKLATASSEDYPTAYKITGIEAASDPFYYMFAGTGGTFTGTPAINNTYYTFNTIVG